MYRPRRALLYMPGSSEKMLKKAPTLGADTVCMDLEGEGKGEEAAWHGTVALASIHGICDGGLWDDPRCRG